MDKIDITDIVSRGVDPNKIIPGAKELEEKLATSDKPLNVYLGIDPTATRLHLGHAVPLRKLKKFADGGHNTTFLIGDFTALVGDTSDKESERPILTPEEIEENFKTYKQQVKKILKLTKVTIRNNSEWLSKLTLTDLIRLTQKFSLNDFISRELIRKRLDEGKHIRLDEVLYPIMQGYDSYFMDIDVQIGAADQIFNMQAGRTLQKLLRNRDSYVLPTEYLAGTDGHKMSKSFGNAIWLDDTPDEIYKKILKINDGFIPNYFDLATNCSQEDVQKFRERYDHGENPKKLKEELAEIIIAELHGPGHFEEAKSNFESIVGRQAPSNTPILPYTTIRSGATIAEALVDTGLASSGTVAKNLTYQGSVQQDLTILHNPFDAFQIVGNETTIRVGKKFVKITK